VHQPLIEQLANDLSLERELIPQVAHYMLAHYEVLSEDVPKFLTERSGHLEEYELDLIFSPLFTPTLDDIERYIPLIEAHPVAEASLDELVDSLHALKLSAHFSDGFAKVVIPMPRVLILRFVRLLQLTVPLSRSIADLIDQHAVSGDCNRIKALARNRGWRRIQKEALLTEYLNGLPEDRPLTAQRFAFVTDFVASYRPKTLEHLAEQLAHMVESYRTDKDKYVYNEQLEDAQLGRTNSRHCSREIRDFRVNMASEVRRDLGMTALLIEKFD